MHELDSITSSHKHRKHSREMIKVPGLLSKRPGFNSWSSLQIFGRVIKIDSLNLIDFTLQLSQINLEEMYTKQALSHVPT